MVFESTDSWPSDEGQEREMPPPLSSYGFQKLAVEYFARGRVGPVPAALHDRPPVQLRRHRRGPGAGRRRGAQRQREAGHEPRRARPRAEGAEGPGPAAHPRRRHPGPPLHLRRRPGPGIVTAMEHPAARNDDFNLSTARVHHRARAGRAHLAQDQGPDVPLPLRVRPGLRARRAASGCPATDKAQRGPRLRGHHDRSTRCSTRSSPGSSRRWPTAASSVVRGGR